MKVLIISCSKKAWVLGEQVKAEWENTEQNIEIVHKTKTKMLPELSISERIEDLVAASFAETDVLLFICASGIAVRSIAPLIRHKSQDPAVLVMDETGKFCISLLSGHAGGANFYAQQIASLVGAQPVITTATDREGKFAVDVFARENGLKILNWKRAKDISVNVLSDETVAVLSDFPVAGKLPSGLTFSASGKDVPAIWITNKERVDNEGIPDGALKLVVPNITLGIGCRKDTDFALIETAVKEFLSEQNIDIHAVKRIASIDLKAEEEGLLKLSSKYHFEFRVYSAEELSKLEGDFSESEFVAKVTGVSNVCERAAIADGGKLVVKKTRFPQVTLAMAETETNLTF